jgi:hypothetical protein
MGSPKISEGDFNVANAVCDFACDVDAGTFRVPRYGWADSPAADCCCDFVGLSLPPWSQHGLKVRGAIWPLVCAVLAVTSFAASGIFSRAEEEQRQARHWTVLNYHLTKRRFK